VGGPNLGRFAALNQLILGELADRLQHRKPNPPRGPVGDQQRLAHQRVEQIEGGEIIIGTHYGTGALEIESPGEHRTPIEQWLFRLVEQVVGPRHCVAQCLVA
jgi:hypothetical protein